MYMFWASRRLLPWLPFRSGLLKTTKSIGFSNMPKGLGEQVDGAHFHHEFKTLSPNPNECLWQFPVLMTDLAALFPSMASIAL